MTAPDYRATEYDVDLALLDAALHDLGRALGPEQAEQLYHTDKGFHFAVDILLRAGWWPHSPDADARREAKDLARRAAAIAMGTMWQTSTPQELT